MANNSQFRSTQRRPWPLFNLKMGSNNYLHRLSHQCLTFWIFENSNSVWKCGSSASCNHRNVSSENKQSLLEYLFVLWYEFYIFIWNSHSIRWMMVLQEMYQRDFENRFTCCQQMLWSSTMELIYWIVLIKETCVTGQLIYLEAEVFKHCLRTLVEVKDTIREQIDSILLDLLEKVMPNWRNDRTSVYGNSAIIK